MAGVITWCVLATALFALACCCESRTRGTASLTRDAVDHLPSGICLARRDGVPILVNCKMETLSSELTGHAILDARSFWQEAASLSSASSIGDKCKAETDEIELRLADGRVYQLVRNRIQGASGLLQIVADDVTEFVAMRDAVAASNGFLAEQNARQEDLLARIVEINHAKELLSIQMRAHDQLGECLILTQMAFESDDPAEAIDEIIPRWNTVLGGLGPEHENRAADAESQTAELEEVAELIGCRISWGGDLPQTTRARLLTLDVVREALGNAARHGGATVLSVACSTEGRWHILEIEDNGTGRNAANQAMQGGNGLTNLRRKLEEEGAALSVSYGNAVKLRARIPIETAIEYAGGEISSREVPQHD